MTKLLFFLTLLPGILFAQKQDCSPKRNTTLVCDSISNLCRIDAHYLSMVAVSKPASKWYDSLYLPKQLQRDYEECLRAMYNGLPDSLADFRWHLQRVYDSAAVFQPDSSKVMVFYFPQEWLETDFDVDSKSGKRSVDSLLMDLYGFEYYGVTQGSVEYVALQYLVPPQVNLAFVERQLQKLNEQIWIGGLPRFTSDNFFIDISEGQDNYAIQLMEANPDWNTEIPGEFYYFKRTFYFSRASGFRYGKFERGLVYR